MTDHRDQQGDLFTPRKQAEAPPRPAVPGRIVPRAPAPPQGRPARPFIAIDEDADTFRHPARTPAPVAPRAPVTPPAAKGGFMSLDDDDFEEPSPEAGKTAPPEERGFLWAGDDQDDGDRPGDDAADAMPVPAPPIARADAGLEEISGRIKRLLYDSGDDFKVYLVTVGREDVRLSTNLPGQFNEKEKVVAKGRWKPYKDGQTFQATLMHLDIPRDSAGVFAWLSTAKIGGVGSHTAKKLAQAFPDGGLQEAIADPGALVKAGIDPRKAELISKAWTTSASQPELVAYLGGLGIGPSALSNIIRQYGMRSRSIIATNPWDLADQVDGVGFATADFIGTRAGHPKDSPDRIRAGIRFALRDSLQRDGHCGLPIPELVKLSSDLLRLDPKAVAAFVDSALEHEKFTFDEATQLATTKAVKQSEAGVALHLSDLNGVDGASRGEASRAIDTAQRELSISLDASQREAAISALTNKVCVITGGPGTGKSTTMKVVVRALKALGNDTVLAAPTGRAAKRLADVSGEAASTCHRLLQYKAEVRGFQFHSENPFKEDHFVVDEFSMVDVSLANSFIQAIRPGAGLTIVGDVDQLPSVGPGQVLRDLIESDTLPVARLTTVHRQGKDSGIVVASHRVNSGLHPVPKGQKLDGFTVDAVEMPVASAARVVELLSTELPAMGFDPLTDVQVLAPMRKGDAGVEHLNEQIKAALNPARDGDDKSTSIKGRTFTAGDRVMHIRNDYIKGVYNGEVGTVVRGGTRMNDKDKPVPFVVVDYSGEEVDYGPSTIDDLDPAWATTIHKSQGCEFPVVILAVNAAQRFMLNRNLVYTGITRAKQLCIVVGTDRVLEYAAAQVDRTRRHTGLVTMLHAQRDRRSALTTAPSPGMSPFLQIEF